jgi:hypothetical protein
METALAENVGEVLAVLRCLLAICGLFLGSGTIAFLWWLCGGSKSFRG